MERENGLVTRGGRWVLGTAWAAVACSPPAQVPKVLLIGIDGVRVDILAEADTPAIDSLIAAGAFTAAASNVSPTVSGPNWSSMLTGVGPNKHGVHSNDFSGNSYAGFPDFLTRLEQVDSSWNTAAIVDWPPLASETSGGPMFGPAIDHRVMVDGDSVGYTVADSLVVEVAVEHLLGGDPDAMFVYLGDVDEVGHAHGSLSAEYRVAIETADRQVSRLVRAMRSRSAYGRERWLVLLSTDHGRRDDGGHGGASQREQTIFYLASGTTVVPGAVESPTSIVDVAVTALVHLGIAVDTAWRLDGQPVGLARSR